MNKSILIILFGIYIACISSCSKYDPIYGVVDNVIAEPLLLNKDLAYIHDNDIYLVNEILSDRKQLTFTSTITKTEIAISPQHDKIAYLDGNGTPIIIDTSGNQLEVLSQYNNVKDIGWHSNNGNPTLYILVNSTIEFYGQALNISSSPFGYVFPTDATFTTIDAIDIDNDLNIAFSFRYQKPFSISFPNDSKYYYGVGVQYSSTSLVDVYHETYEDFYSTTSTTYSAQAYQYYHKVNLNLTTQNLYLGRISNGNESSYTSYSLWDYNINSTVLNTFNSNVSSGNYYMENSTGHVSANIYEIEKYLIVLPPKVPAPTGTANTFRLNFSNSNNTMPTYFDWQP